jgi:O-acetyl-ADP-ribose deacetylase (regulator of RNase III)
VIIYLQGDAANPQVDGNRIIAHVCNDIGAWGRGFVRSLSRRWPRAEDAYRRWHKDQENALVDPDLSSKATIGEPLKLGAVQYVRVDSWDGPNETILHTYVANMVAQHGIGNRDGVPPIRYDALQQCLEHVGFFAQTIGTASIHMPRIGCGLAGGEWSKVEPLVASALDGWAAYVYDLDTRDARTVPWRR